MVMTLGSFHMNFPANDSALPPNQRSESRIIVEYVLQKRSPQMIYMVYVNAKQNNLPRDHFQ
jgi:hypothetical protein